METFPKYGSIENLYKCKDILDHSVVILEKIHGTNCRFMWCKEHGLVLGGRNLILYKDGEQGTHDGYSFTNYMLNDSDIDFEQLKKYENYVFYGEYHGSGIQKGIVYTADRTKDLRIFDIRNPDGDYLSWTKVSNICNEIDIKTVPVITAGNATVDSLEELLNKESQTARSNGIIMGDNYAEGIIIKPSFPQRDKYGNWMRAKLKADRWKEKASKSKVARPLKPEQIALNEAAAIFAQEVVTEGRVHTIVEHITRDGNTKIDMSRTPDFLKELSKDIWEEHEVKKELLERKDQKVYNKAISSQGIALWKKYVKENYNG